MAKQPFSAEHFRQHFPFFRTHSSLYFDSATTALKCDAMIQATNHYYAQNLAPIAEQLQAKYDDIPTLCDTSRQLVADFIQAKSAKNIIWTSGATAAVNLITQGFVREWLGAGDEIILSEAEHNSNVLPWRIVAQQTGAKIVKLPLNSMRQLDIDALPQLITPRTKMLVITQQSNVTGETIDLEKCVKIARKHHLLIAVDGSQGIVHQHINVEKGDLDFYFFSAHKLYGPTGIGALYAKTAHLEKMFPALSGSKIIQKITFDEYTLTDIPHRFEPGTQNIAGILGFGATLSWLKTLDLHAAEKHSREMTKQAYHALASDPNFIFYQQPSTLLTFNYRALHYADLAEYLIGQNIALREGVFCADNMMQTLNPAGDHGAIRLSFAPYNTVEETQKLIHIIQHAVTFLRE